MLVGRTACMRMASSRIRIVRSVPCCASSLGNQLLCDAQARSDGCAVTSLFQAGDLDVRANVAALDRQPDDSVLRQQPLVEDRGNAHSGGNRAEHALAAVELEAFRLRDAGFEQQLFERLPRG